MLDRPVRRPVGDVFSRAWRTDRRLHCTGARVRIRRDGAPITGGVLTMNRNLSRTIQLGLLTTAIAAAACAGSGPASAPIPSDPTGTIGMRLALPGGETLTTVTWTIFSGAATVRSGTIDVTNNPTVSFVVGGLPAGSFTIRITGVSVDGSVTCAGSGAFTIVAQQTAEATVNLACTTPRSDAGTVDVNTTLNQCATLQSISASAAEVFTGGTVTLTATATAPTPGAIAYQWSAPGGTFGSPTSATTTFTSTSPGPITVTVQASDGSVTPGFACDASLDSSSLQLTFDAPSDGGPANAAGSIYVVDSTPRLFSFGAAGDSRGNVLLPGPIGNINGGGIELAGEDLYVTVGQFTNAVASYSLTLAPQALPAGAFAGLSVPRGIAYDVANGDFYVGNGAATVNVYGGSGAAVAVGGGFPGFFGPSGVAYDADDDTIWVANYVGAPAASPPVHGVAEYAADGSAASTFSYATQFVAPGPHEEPYSIAVCPASVAGGSTAVVVGFIDDGSGQGTGAVQSYSTAGAPIGSPFAGPIVKPYGLSCDSEGNVYIADASGLYRGSIGGANLGLPGPFAGITAPVYGVVANVSAPVRAVGDGGPRIPADSGPDSAPSSARDSGPDSGPITIALSYSVPLTSTGSPPTTGTADPNNQTLAFHVVSYDSATTLFSFTSSQVTVQAVHWEPTPTDLGFTVTPLASSDVWAPFFSASDGYIQIDFDPPVSSVTIDEQVLYSGPQAGTALLPLFRCRSWKRSRPAPRRTATSSPTRIRAACRTGRRSRSACRATR